MKLSIDYRNAPILSIIVPNYNHYPFLEERLDSVFNQTFQDFEVILLDDASTDDSVHILQEYAKKYKEKISHFIINKKNSGSPFKQWKKGIELATGEFIWIAESDDYADISFLERIMDTYKGNNKDMPIDVIFVNSVLYTGNSVGEKYNNLIDEKYSASLIKGRSVLINWFLARKGPYIGNASSTVFKRSCLIESIQIKNLNWFKFAGDKYFWLMLLRNAQCYYINTPLNYFRQHSFNTSKTKASTIKKVTRNTLENVYILSQLNKLTILSNEEKRMLRQEKLRHINQISNRATTLFYKLVGFFLKKTMT